MDTTPLSGYLQQEYKKQVKRYCQTLDLRDNPELIKEYRRIHSEDAMWQEIIDGIRQVGILEMEIYILGTRLFMIVETAPSFDWESAMKRLGSLPRQTEWEALTAKYQMADANAGSAEKWQLMERMFHLYK